MTAPDRPTREEVAAALAAVESCQSCADPHVAHRLTVEVHALRDKVEVQEIAFQGQAATERWLRAQLAARTPQPADPADTAEAGDHLGKAWVDAQQTLHAGGCRAVAPGGVWMCTRSGHPNGSQHVSTVGGRVVVVWGAAPQPAEPSCAHDPKWNHTRDGRCAVPGCAPLPAVPDGEERAPDQVADLRAALVRREKELKAALQRLHQSQNGEDVPARLDAAAEALASLEWSGASEELRHISFLLKHDDAAEVRAALAAALARPTGGTT